MAKKIDKTSPQSSETEANKAPLPKKPAETLQDYLSIEDNWSTGLADYGFWCEQVKKERAAKTEPDPPFRRGRIWT